MKYYSHHYLVHHMLEKIYSICNLISWWLNVLFISDILQGSVGVINNYNLCHMETIEWREIMTDLDATYTFTYNFSVPQPTCQCDKACKKGCWGEGEHNCQKFSKLTCSPQCAKGRCYGTGPRDCCHLFCAGGCTGPTQRDCLVGLCNHIVTYEKYKNLFIAHNVKCKSNK